MKALASIALILLLFRGGAVGTGVPLFDVLKYGAVGDGKTLDTGAIQKAINVATASGP